MKYTIKIIDNETGIEFAKPVECDGYLIAGCVGGESFESLRLRVHQLSEADITNVLYTDIKLRRAAYAMAKLKPVKRMTFLRRLLFGRVRR